VVMQEGVLNSKYSSVKYSSSCILSYEQFMIVRLLYMKYGYAPFLWRDIREDITNSLFRRFINRNVIVQHMKYIEDAKSFHKTHKTTIAWVLNYKFNKVFNNVKRINRYNLG